MAGELILPVSADIDSIDWTASADGKRGDIVRVNNYLTGFLLDDVSANGVVGVGIEAKQVTVPQPGTPRAWKAGDLVGWHGGELVPRTTTVDTRIGYVHHDTPATEARVPVVWRGTNDSIGYSYYRILNPNTTPSFSLTDLTVDFSVTGGAARRVEAAKLLPIDEDGSLEFVLATDTTLGVRPGIPIIVDYEGDLLWGTLRNQHGLGATSVDSSGQVLPRDGAEDVNMEVSLGYRLWHDDPTKAATTWRQSFRDSPRGREIGISMDSFSNHPNWPAPLDVGTQVPRDSDGDFVTVTEDDFENGIPVQIRLRFRGFSVDSISTRASYRDRRRLLISLLHLLHAQVVTYQVGARLA